MKKKIVSLMVLVVLLTPVLLVTAEPPKGFLNKIRNKPHYFVTDSLNFSIGLELVFQNIGSAEVRDIEWSFSAEGGTIIFGDGISGRIPVLLPEDEIIVILMPAPGIFPDAQDWSPTGFGDIIMNLVSETSTGETAEDRRDGFLLGPIILMN